MMLFLFLFSFSFRINENNTRPPLMGMLHMNSPVVKIPPQDLKNPTAHKESYQVPKYFTNETMYHNFLSGAGQFLLGEVRFG
jgi:hypothetical protein